MEPDAVQRQNKPLECRLILLGALSVTLCLCPLVGLGQGAGVDWDVYLGDKASTQFSSLDQINRNNVRGLQVAWSYHSGNASGEVLAVIHEGRDTFDQNPSTLYRKIGRCRRPAPGASRTGACDPSPAPSS